MDSDTQYRAVYATKNGGKQDGALTSNLEELHKTAEGIVKHWPLVFAAEIYSYPNGTYVYGYFARK
jgi:hypothetical protein